MVNSPVLEVFFGGSRGGGKTDGFLGDFGIHAQECGSAAQGLWVRRQRFPDMGQAMKRAEQIYPQAGARWNGQTYTWTWPSGAKLLFAPIRDISDAGSHQGNQYSRVYCEEMTTYPESAPLDMLKGTLRSEVGAPVGFRGNANPGGVGHTWVKARYIDPAPLGWEIIKDANGMERVYIPSRLQDNPILLKNNPNYVGLIKQTGPEALVKAWLDGDWNIIEGVYFDNWSDRNILPAFQPPKDWIRFMSYDYGFSKPFSIGWWVVVPHETIIGGKRLNRGALVRYREWYGAKKTDEGRTIPNKGAKLELSDVRNGIAIREKGEKITMRVADPSIFKADDGPSIAEQLRLGFTKGDNRRVPGWQNMYQRISGVDGDPMLFITANCIEFNRTIPAMPHDLHNSEDIDTDAEDHIADEVRYMCMARPWAPRLLKPTVKHPQDYGFKRRRQQSSGWVM